MIAFRALLRKLPLAAPAVALFPLAASALIGGAPVRDGEFASQLSLQRPVAGETPGFIHHCSATKISGEWILTAEHCVAGELSAGDQVRIQSGPNLRSPAISTVTELLEIRLASSEPNGPGHDLALVRVGARALRGIPEASLESGGRAMSARVDLTGYGCESIDWALPSTELKSGRTRITGFDGADFLLPADPMGGFFPTLCLGDSGGGMFARVPGGGGKTIEELIGVNSAIGMLGDGSAGNSRVTRLDGGAGFDAMAWIRAAISGNARSLE